MSYMIKLTPTFKDYLWGGTRLRDDFGKDCTLAVVAESWELSTHPDGLCRITGGAADGQTLAAWLFDHPAALGTRAGERTEAPVLIKFIDAAQNLSVQVHPDDDYARRVENDMGKTELWYVLDAAEGAEVIYGVSAPLSRQELADRAADGSITEVLCHVPVKRGDALLVRAGLCTASVRGRSYVRYSRHRMSHIVCMITDGSPQTASRVPCISKRLRMLHSSFHRRSAL